MVETHSISSFWAWFEENLTWLTEDYANPLLVTELDEAVRDLGPFAWEVGPERSGGLFFALSPGGRVELLEETRRVINQAPECRGWAFYPAKPPREWTSTFVLHPESGPSIEVDPSRWAYVLLKRSKGQFGLVLDVRSTPGLSQSDRRDSVEVVLNALLGEELALASLAYVEVVEGMPDEFKGRANSIEVLGEHFRKALAASVGQSH